METDTIKKVIYIVAAIIALLLLSYMIGRRDGINKAARDQKTEVDTLLIRDTITQYKPILEERVVLQKVLVPVMDTLVIRDTMYVVMEREQVVWQDSLSKVYVSGVLPQIDSVKHYVSEKIITRELTNIVKKPCKWGIGVQAGYGIQLGEQVKTAPYIGIGISYNLISW